MNSDFNQVINPQNSTFQLRLFKKETQKCIKYEISGAADLCDKVLIEAGDLQDLDSNFYTTPDENYTLFTDVTFNKIKISLYHPISGLG